MPKININGVTRDMTAEEEAELARMLANQPERPKSPEELLAELQARQDEAEAALMELAELQAANEIRADEADAALMELASMVSE